MTYSDNRPFVDFPEAIREIANKDHDGDERRAEADLIAALQDGALVAINFNNLHDNILGSPVARDHWQTYPASWRHNKFRILRAALSQVFGIFLTQATAKIEPIKSALDHVKRNAEAIEQRRVDKLVHEAWMNAVESEARRNCPPQNRPVEPFWNAAQLLLWVSTRNLECVGSCAGLTDGALKGTRVVATAIAFEININFDRAKADTIRAISEGKITARGVPNGAGDPQDIPSEAWAHLNLADNPMIAVSTSSETNWRQLRFRSDQCMAIWPPPDAAPVQDQASESADGEGSDKKGKFRGARKKIDAPESDAAKVYQLFDEIKSAGQKQKYGELSRISREIARQTGYEPNTVEGMIRPAYKLLPTSDS